MTFDLNEYIRKQNLWKGVNVYAWMANDGVPLAPPDTNKEAALALKETMQAKCDKEDEVIRLACFTLNEEETVCTLYPPPDPEEMKGFRVGGHAIGFTPTTLDDFVSEMKQYLGMVYKDADKVEYLGDIDTRTVEHNCVRVSIQKLPNAEKEGTFNRYERVWKVWLTNTRVYFKTDKPKITPVGTYWTLHRAIQEALNAFLKEQVQEAILCCI